MARLRFSALPVALFLAGCATMPVARAIERTATLPASVDDTWNAVIDIFGEQGWAIDNMERASGLITTDWMGGQATRTYMDCGSAGLSVDSDHSGRFNIVVRGDESGSSVTVNTTFRTYRSFGNAGNWVECVSNGSFEGYVHDRLELRFGASTGPR